MNRTCRALLAAAIAAQFGTGAAMAQQITLRVADHYPAGSPSAAMTAGYFMDEVTKRTNGRVKFEYFPAQQLGKASDMLKLTLSGVTDIGFAAPAYVSDKLPLGAVAELPGTFSSPCEGTRAFLKLARDGILRDREYKPNEVRLLIALMLPPYQILTRAPITGLDSFKGQKLRTGGGLQDISIKAIGAVPVRIAGPEIYESIARGTLDGLVFPLPSLEQYKLQDQVRYSTIGMNFGSFASSYVISERKWGSLPADIREIMDRAATDASMNACNKMGEDQQPAIERLKAAGVKFVELPAADAARIASLLSPVGEQWAKQLDGRGQPGTQVLNAFLEALKSK